MRVLVYQHIEVEHPGIFRTFLREDSVTCDVVEWHSGDAAPEHANYDALWIMGGPMDVWEENKYPWLISEKQAIRDWVQAEKPVLGICLGHQLLADALGGFVAPMADPEVGVQTIKLTDAGIVDPLFDSVDRHNICLQWHGSEVNTLPRDAVLLAASAGCDCQAFRYGERVYGLQYHMEVTEETVDNWAKVPAYAESLKNSLGLGGESLLASAVEDALPQLNRIARRIYNNFKRLV